MLRAAALALLLGQVYSQFLNGRRLEGPILALCDKRIIHDRFNGTGYYFSWKEEETKNVEYDWLGVRNWCRNRCMDSVSVQTSVENEFIKKHITNGKIKYIWTSGRLCDFKGCEREDLQPRRENGWFWTSTLQKLPPSTNRVQNDWSDSGGIKLPQPDNREEQQNGAPENCIAILNNLYGDGIHWHDVACHHKKPFICEESRELIKYTEYIRANKNK